MSKARDPSDWSRVQSVRVSKSKAHSKPSKLETHTPPDPWIHRTECHRASRKQLIQRSRQRAAGEQTHGQRDMVLWVKCQISPKAHVLEHLVQLGAQP